MKVEAIIKLKQPEVYKQLKKERKENLSFDFYKKLMEEDKDVDVRKCR